ncbi:MAG: FAD-dependent oxidoreductase [Aestuariivirga sp.]|uniref:flavin monoamine oxidase family protein n=1 Tax=Aestuariivirga sp. TaxID=2650926 RepID=UPI00301729D0
MRTTVAIVGGGLSGLYAARLLQDAEVDFELFEARQRFGGRILSVGATGEPSTGDFDLGPSWFWPGMHPRMARVVDGLGLDSFPQYSIGDVLVERSRLGEPQRFPTIRQEPQSMRLKGGTSAIVAALVNGCPPERLHLGASVTRLALRDDGVVLYLKTDEGDHEGFARYVILAAPPRLLASAITFDPILEPGTRERWQRAATWMAPHAKFFALYDEPFWREAGLSGMAQSGVGPLVEIHDATTSSGEAALFGFVGIGREQRMALGEDALVRASLAQLVRLFGRNAGLPRATLFKDWAADALTATSADMVAESHPVPDGRPWISGAWTERVSLAGSETSSTDPGYLAGALDAAERAVRETCVRIAGVDQSL